MFFLRLWNELVGFEGSSNIEVALASCGARIVKGLCASAMPMRKPR